MGAALTSAPANAIRTTSHGCGWSAAASRSPIATMIPATTMQARVNPAVRRRSAARPSVADWRPGGRSPFRNGRDPGEALIR